MAHFSSAHIVTTACILVVSAAAHCPAVEPHGAATTDAAESKFLHLAKEIADSINRDDPAAINGVINKSEICRRATKSLQLPLRFSTAFISGFSANFDLGRNICNATKGGGSYAFLRLHNVDGVTHALFRLLQSDGSLNYHDLVLGTTGDGRAEIEDLYVYATGELMSETVRRMVLLALTKDPKGNVTPLADKDSDFMKHLDDTVELPKAIGERRFDDATAIYARMPKSLQQDKLYMVLNCMAAANGNEDAYRQALDTFAEAFPGDPAVDLTSLDALYLKKRYGDMLAALDRLDKRVGGDPYLSVLRSVAYRGINKPADARRVLRQAVADEPGLQQGYQALLNIAVAENDHVETARLLTILERKFAVKLRDLTQIDEYREFCKSPEYAALEVRRKEACSDAASDQP